MEQPDRVKDDIKMGNLKVFVKEASHPSYSPITGSIPENVVPRSGEYGKIVNEEDRENWKREVRRFDKEGRLMGTEIHYPFSKTKKPEFIKATQKDVLMSANVINPEVSDTIPEEFIPKEDNRSDDVDFDSVHNNTPEPSIEAPSQSDDGFEMEETVRQKIMEEQQKQEQINELMEQSQVYYEPGDPGYPRQEGPDNNTIKDMLRTMMEFMKQQTVPQTPVAMQAPAPETPKKEEKKVDRPGLTIKYSTEQTSFAFKVVAAFPTDEGGLVLVENKEDDSAFSPATAKPFELTLEKKGKTETYTLINFDIKFSYDGKQFTVFINGSKKG